MKKFLVIIAVCLFSMFLQSWYFYSYPEGVWTCEELGLTVDFKDNSWKKPSAQMLIDEISQEVEFVEMSFTGWFFVCHQSEDSERDYWDTLIFGGHLSSSCWAKRVLRPSITGRSAATPSLARRTAQRIRT